MRGIAKNLLVITAQYPNNTGDAAFIRTEIGYMSRVFKHIVVLSHGDPDMDCVPSPPNVTVLYFHKAHPRYLRYPKYILWLFTPSLWKEFFLIVRHKKNISCCFAALAFLGNVFIEKKQIAAAVARHHIDLCYTFWFWVSTLSCLMLHDKPVCTRTHRFDLYELRNNNNYQPFKIQMDRETARVLFISKNGLEYYRNTFATRENDVYKLCYLGTENSEPFCAHDYAVSIHLLSVSNVVPVKRIHLIIEALALCSKGGIKISWTHIGDGTEMQNIVCAAQEKLGYGDFVTYRFLGAKTNVQVCDYYKDNAVDLFVNMSESEGLPVSIMEAMSYGVPVIAPDVGGISEIVDGASGWLLNKEHCVAEFISVIKEWANMPATKRQQKARNAYHKWNTTFNAEKNYAAFAEEMLNVMNNWTYTRKDCI